MNDFISNYAQYAKTHYASVIESCGFKYRYAELGNISIMYYNLKDFKGNVNSLIEGAYYYCKKIGINDCILILESKDNEFINYLINKDSKNFYN